MKEEQIIVGGQAVIEGVMMRTPHAYAVAVRLENGEIIAKGERLPLLSERYPMLKLPLLRGAATLIHSMILGIKALNFSANGVLHEGEPAKQSAAEAAVAGAGLTTAVAGTKPVASGKEPIAKPAPAPKSASAEAKKATNAAAAGSMVFAIIFNIF